MAPDGWIMAGFSNPFVCVCVDLDVWNTPAPDITEFSRIPKGLAINMHNKNACGYMHWDEN